MAKGFVRWLRPRVLFSARSAPPDQRPDPLRAGSGDEEPPFRHRRRLPPDSRSGGNAAKTGVEIYPFSPRRAHELFTGKPAEILRIILEAQLVIARRGRRCPVHQRTKAGHARQPLPEAGDRGCTLPISPVQPFELGDEDCGLKFREWIGMIPTVAPELSPLSDFGR